jgi:hypothetical protein
MAFLTMRSVARHLSVRALATPSKEVRAHRSSPLPTLSMRCEALPLLHSYPCNGLSGLSMDFGPRICEQQYRNETDEATWACRSSIRRMTARPPPGTDRSTHTLETGK